MDPNNSQTVNNGDRSSDDTSADGASSSSKSTCQLIPGPPQVKFIITNELCERYSYYGMRAILVKYLSDVLGFSDDNAASYFMYFCSLCYFTPLLGGYISDSYWGKFNTIWRFSIIYCIGGILMAVSGHFGDADVETAKKFCLAGLVLIGFGTGGIKPCVSAFGADQLPYEHDRERQLERYFLAFYFSINTGAITSTLVTPIIRQDVGYFWAFLVPALGLLLALIVFLLASKLYIIFPPEGSVLGTIFGVVKTACCPPKRSAKEIEDAHFDMDSLEMELGNPKDDEATAPVKKEKFLERALVKYPQHTIDDVNAVWDLVPIFLCIPIFWALFDQQGSTWEQMAEDMDCRPFTPDQLSFVNSLAILTLIPIFDYVIYPLWAKCQPGVTPLHKMSVGMTIAAGSFLISAFLQKHVSAHKGEVTWLWMLPQYITISIAEVLVSITGLEFAYSQAPLSMKAFISALNLACVGVGDLIAGVLLQALSPYLNRHEILFTFAGLMFANMIVFTLVASCYKMKSYTAEAKEELAEMAHLKDEERGERLDMPKRETADTNGTVMEKAWNETRASLRSTASAGA